MGWRGEGRRGAGKEERTGEDGGDIRVERRRDTGGSVGEL